MIARITSPLLGAKVLALLVAGAVLSCSVISHSREGFVISYVLAGLMLFGLVVQGVSIARIKTLHGWKRTVWWIASTVYGLWLAAACAALFHS